MIQDSGIRFQISGKEYFTGLANFKKAHYQDYSAYRETLFVTSVYLVEPEPLATENFVSPLS